MDKNELKNRFMYHSPKTEQMAKYQKIRNHALNFALLINEMCPESREKSLAITHLEDAVYCANASIARNE